MGWNSVLLAFIFQKNIISLLKILQVFFLFTSPFNIFLSCTMSKYNTKMSSTSTTYQKKCQVLCKTSLLCHVCCLLFLFSFLDSESLRNHFTIQLPPNTTVSETVRCMWTYVHRTVPDTVVSAVVCVSLLFGLGKSPTVPVHTAF